MARDNDNFCLKHSFNLQKKAENTHNSYSGAKRIFKKMKRGKNDSYEILFSKEGKGKEIKS